MTKTAEDLGVSTPLLSLVLRGKRQPGPKLLDALGLKRKVVRKTSYFAEKA